MTTLDSDTITRISQQIMRDPALREEASRDVNGVFRRVSGIELPEPMTAIPHGDKYLIVPTASLNAEGMMDELDDSMLDLVSAGGSSCSSVA
jgi:hypothetical protein